MLLCRSFHASSRTHAKLSNLQLIKKLREELQAPLNIVKTAVAEAQPAGDYDAALVLLKKAMKKRGEKLVAKSADRTATEGWVVAARSACGKAASLTIVNCETDFVAKSDGVIDLARTVGRALADQAAQSSEATPSTLSPVPQRVLDALEMQGQPLSQKLTESISVFGESIRLTQALTTVRSKSAGHALGIHCHGAPSGSPTQDVFLGRMGALIQVVSQQTETSQANLQQRADELAREVVAQNPDSLEEFWTLDKVGDAEGRTVRQWAGEDVSIEAWARWERDQTPA